ncbi:hypothetical protein CAP48_16715 [Advenella sp. S44]|nr:hypothetical protein CAP48_16715 [Advenella sp. S44]
MTIDAGIRSLLPSAPFTRPADGHDARGLPQAQTFCPKQAALLRKNGGLCDKKAYFPDIYVKKNSKADRISLVGYKAGSVCYVIKNI